MRTIKGNITQLNIVIKKSNQQTTFIQTFNIDDIKIKLTTEQSVKAKEGDLVVVAGVESYDHIFKAYSFKKL